MPKSTVSSRSQRQMILVEREQLDERKRETLDEIAALHRRKWFRQQEQLAEQQSPTEPYLTRRKFKISPDRRREMERIEAEIQAKMELTRKMEQAISRNTSELRRLHEEKIATDVRERERASLSPVSKGTAYPNSRPVLTPPESSIESVSPADVQTPTTDSNSSWTTPTSSGSKLTKVSSSQNIPGLSTSSSIGASNPSSYPSDLIPPATSPLPTDTDDIATIVVPSLEDSDSEELRDFQPTTYFSNSQIFKRKKPLPLYEDSKRLVEMGVPHAVVKTLLNLRPGEFERSDEDLETLRKSIDAISRASMGFERVEPMFVDEVHGIGGGVFPESGWLRKEFTPPAEAGGFRSRPGGVEWKDVIAQMDKDINTPTTSDKNTPMTVNGAEDRSSSKQKRQLAEESPRSEQSASGSHEDEPLDGSREGKKRRIEDPNDEDHDHSFWSSCPHCSACPHCDSDTDKTTPGNQTSDKDDIDMETVWQEMHASADDVDAPPSPSTTSSGPSVEHEGAKRLTEVLHRPQTQARIVEEEFWRHLNIGNSKEECWRRAQEELKRAIEEEWEAHEERRVAFEDSVTKMLREDEADAQGSSGANFVGEHSPVENADGIGVEQSPVEAPDPDLDLDFLDSLGTSPLPPSNESPPLENDGYPLEYDEMDIYSEEPPSRHSPGENFPGLLSPEPVPEAPESPQITLPTEPSFAPASFFSRCPSFHPPNLVDLLDEKDRPSSAFSPEDEFFGGMQGLSCSTCYVQIKLALGQTPLAALEQHKRVHLRSSFAPPGFDFFGMPPMFGSPVNTESESTPASAVAVPTPTSLEEDSTDRPEPSDPRRPEEFDPSHLSLQPTLMPLDGLNTPPPADTPEEEILTPPPPLLDPSIPPTSSAFTLRKHQVASEWSHLQSLAESELLLYPPSDPRHAEALSRRDTYANRLAALSRMTSPADVLPNLTSQTAEEIERQALRRMDNIIRQEEWLHARQLAEGEINDFEPGWPRRSEVGKLWRDMFAMSKHRIRGMDLTTRGSSKLGDSGGGSPSESVDLEYPTSPTEEKEQMLDATLPPESAASSSSTSNIVEESQYYSYDPSPPSGDWLSTLFQSGGVVPLAKSDTAVKATRGLYQAEMSSLNLSTVPHFTPASIASSTAEEQQQLREKLKGLVESYDTSHPFRSLMERKLSLFEEYVEMQSFMTRQPLPPPHPPTTLPIPTTPPPKEATPPPPEQTIQEKFDRASTAAYKKLVSSAPKQSPQYKTFVEKIGTHDELVSRGFSCLERLLKHETFSSLEDVYSFLHVAYAISQTECADPARSTPVEFKRGIDVLRNCLSDDIPPDIDGSGGGQNTTGDGDDGGVGGGKEDNRSKSDRGLFDEIVEVMWTEVDYAISWIGKQTNWGGWCGKMEKLQRSMDELLLSDQSDDILDPGGGILPELLMGMDVMPYGDTVPMDIDIDTTFELIDLNLLSPSGHDPRIDPPTHPPEKLRGDEKSTWLDIVRGGIFIIVVSFLQVVKSTKDPFPYHPPLSPTKQQPLPYSFLLHPTDDEYTLPQLVDYKSNFLADTLHSHILFPLSTSTAKLLSTAISLVREGIISTVRHFEYYVLGLLRIFNRNLSKQKHLDFAEGVLRGCWTCAVFVKEEYGGGEEYIKSRMDDITSHPRVEEIIDTAEKITTDEQASLLPFTPSSIPTPVSSIFSSAFQSLTPSSIPTDLSPASFNNNSPPYHISSIPLDLPFETHTPSPSQFVPLDGGEEGTPTCEYCGKTFSTAPNLYRHRRVFHPEIGKRKVFYCGVGECEHRSTRKDNVDKHRKVKHGVKVVKQVKARAS